MTDVVVIGGGHNGLIAAAMLAKAGRSVLVLERTDRVGGCARTTELAPGFRCPALSHAAAIDPAIVRALALERHGLQILRGEADVCAPLGGGRALTLWHDVGRARESIRAFSPKDADRYSPFLETFARIAGVLRRVSAMPPPSIDDPAAGDLIDLLTTGRAFRALGKADAYRLLRWMPMAVADLVAEFFDSEPLRAAVAGGGILGSFFGPWSAGSGAQLLLLGATEGHPVASGWFAKGGTGAVADALASAARAAGVEIRTNAEVAAIAVADGRATGVTLAGGEQVSASTIVANVDPKRAFSLVDPMHLAPEFISRLINIRAHGTLAKVNFAVSALPRIASDASALSGRVRLARDIDAIERAFDAAKYGGFSESPWIELTIPSIVDPSLAPAGAHVVSAYVQYTPYHLRGSDWDAERERLGRIATNTIASYAAGFEASIVAREVITPLDLERTHGLSGGHIFHGEIALDQWFVTRPLLGWARYRTPIANLFLCGSGTHPGTGLNGRSGALAAKQILKS